MGNSCRTKVAIDASNISSGGGLTHLVQFLEHAEPIMSGISEIHLWTNTRTASKLKSKSWLFIHTPDWCNSGLLVRLWGQQMKLPVAIKKFDCDILFAPGGTLPFRVHVPSIAMSQNMLPFEPEKARLFGRYSLMRLKMYLLSKSQSRSFINATGVIFLTNYAKNTITSLLNKKRLNNAVIPHGIEPRFIAKPALKNRGHPDNSPLKILYVSTQMPYKHHIEAIKAVNELVKRGTKIEFYLAGESDVKYAHNVKQLINLLDPKIKFIFNLGHVDFENLHKLYAEADIFLFASSCENLPNILIEAMAAGLPIASSDCGPMPEVVGDAAVYFDPQSPASIAEAINKLILDPLLRRQLAKNGWERAKNYSWPHCSRATLDFIVRNVTDEDSKYV